MMFICSKSKDLPADEYFYPAFEGKLTSQHYPSSVRTQYHQAKQSDVSSVVSQSPDLK